MFPTASAGGAEETAPAHREAGPHHDGDAQRHAAGDRLPDHAVHLSGVREPQPAADLEAAAEGRIAGARDQLAGRPVEHKVLALPWLAPRSAVDRDRDGFVSRRGKADRHCAPSGRLGDGARDQHLQLDRRGRRVRRGGQVVPRHRFQRPRRRLERRRVAGQPMDEVGGPLIGDRGAAGDDDGEGNRRPEADHAVPVEVARPPAEAAAEPQRLCPGGAAAGRRPPEVDPAHEQKEEPQVGGRRERPSDDPVLALEGEPPVPVQDAAEEAARSSVAVAQPLAGEAVDVDGGSAVEPDDRRLARIAPQGHGSDESGWPPAVDARDQLVEPERRDVRGRRLGAIAAKRPPVELRLVGEEDAGRRHHEDHDSGGDPDRQMEPEDRPAQGHVWSARNGNPRPWDRRSAPRGGADAARRFAGARLGPGTAVGFASLPYRASLSDDWASLSVA